MIISWQPLHLEASECLPMHVVIMQCVSSCRGAMIGQGNEPQWEQGGTQSGGADTYLSSVTERQTFVLLGSHVHHLTLTSLSLAGSISDNTTVSSTLAITLSLYVSLCHLHLRSLLSCFFFLMLCISAAPLYCLVLQVCVSDVFLSLPVPTVRIVSRVSHLNVTHLSNRHEHSIPVFILTL